MGGLRRRMRRQAEVALAKVVREEYPEMREASVAWVVQNLLRPVAHEAQRQYERGAARRRRCAPGGGMIKFGWVLRVALAMALVLAGAVAWLLSWPLQ